MNFYEPNEDTYLLIDILQEDSDFILHKTVLELGCGSGLISQSLSPTNFTILTDINLDALTNLGDKFPLIHCNLLCNINQSLIDIIIFNPPYVPGPALNTPWVNYACNGGVNGTEAIFEFIDQVEVDCFYLLFISANRPREVVNRIVGRGYRLVKVRSRKILGELLVVVKCVKSELCIN